MATAQIVFTQAPGGTRPAGEDVEDGVVGNAVTVTNATTDGIASWILKIFDVPEGPEVDSDSAVPIGVFASAANNLVSGIFTPDKFGGFMVELTVIGTDGSVSIDYGTFGCPNELGWFRPGFKQSVASSRFGGALRERGWAWNTDRIQRDARAARLKTFKLHQTMSLVGGLQEAPGGGWKIIGARRFNPLDFYGDGGAGITRSIVFQGFLFATAGMDAQVRLFNFTDGAAVASSVLTVVNTLPTNFSVALTSPGDLPAAAKTYTCEIQISAGGPGPADRVYCLGAELDVLLEG